VYPIKVPTKSEGELKGKKVKKKKKESNNGAEEEKKKKKKGNEGMNK